MNLSPTFNAYIECALWSSTDEDGTFFDDHFVEEDIHPDSTAKMRSDLEDFMSANADLIKRSGLSAPQVGHDFWLTRNGHGAGFWDRGLGKIGDDLADAARAYGSSDLYVGDDGLVHVSP